MAENKRGRPSSYRPEFAEQATKLARLGATDAEVAHFFGVDERTINRWKEAEPTFCQSLKDGKALADIEIADKLFHRARGYSHEAVKIFMPAGASEPVYAPYVEHYAPDTTAAIFWLKNRRPDLWRDVHRQEHTGADGGPIDHRHSIEARQKAAELLLTNTFGPDGLPGDRGGNA